MMITDCAYLFKSFSLKDSLNMYMLIAICLLYDYFSFHNSRDGNVRDMIITLQFFDYVFHSMGDPLAYLLKSFVALMDHDVMSWDDLEPQFIKQVHFNTKKPWAQGYKTFFMLNSAETQIYPAHKC